MKKPITLSDGEWKLMNRLWEGPATITALTEGLREETGWQKNTVITMLSRLEKKGAVRHEDGGRAKVFYPAMDRSEACRRETKGLLDRLYGGSLGLLMSTLLADEDLSDETLEELDAVLRRAEAARRAADETTERS